MCFSNMCTRMDIPIYGLCIDFVDDTLCNQVKRRPIDRFLIARDVCFQRQAILINFISAFLNAQDVIKRYDQYLNN